MSGNINEQFNSKPSNCSLKDADQSQHVSPKKSKKKQKSATKITQTQQSANNSSPSTSSFRAVEVENSEPEKTYFFSDRVQTKKFLPPIGVFWDIENCQVPKGRSAVCVAQIIREMFFDGYREAEFIVVCDVKKETSQVIQDLHDAQVTLIHVASTCKNAADERLRQALRRFADTYEYPATVILLSGDINFAADLSDLRHRKKLHVILIHNDNAADALLLCASEHHSYKALTHSLPIKEVKNNSNNEPMEVIVQNLPNNYDPIRLRNRLKQLSDNCGGRVVYVSHEIGTAIIRFNNLDIAVRAQRRMDGEDVFGNKVSVSYPNSVRNWDRTFAPYRIPVSRLARTQDVYMQSPAVLGNHLSTIPFPYQSSDYNNAALTGRNTSTVISPQMGKNGRMIRGSHSIPVSGPNCSDLSEHWQPLNASFNKNQKSSVHKQEWPKNMSGSFTALNTIDNEDPEKQFQPIVRSNSLSNNSNSTTQPVDLLVTNLDHTLNMRYLKRLLLSLFKEHAMVINLSLFYQSDGNLAATVRVSSTQDAQYVISQLQRRKIGHKRIVISKSQSSSPNPYLLRSQVVALLQEVPGNQLPLFKFRELLETRFRSSVSVSELYKLKNVCNVSDELGGRMVSLSPELRISPQLNVQPGLETHYCTFHCPNGISDRGWAEPETALLPNVRVQLKVFTPKVHKLLHSHMGVLPILSFPICYEIETNEKLPIDDSGVPLEHLITCVVGVELKLSSSLVKYLIWSNQSTNDESHNEDGNSNSSVCGSNSDLKNVLPPLAVQLALFCRELVELLKTVPHCQLALSRFIPAYHHHFGRQCRVADYGYTKLIDLFESLSHIVQIIGEGNKRSITLSHSAQIRRFTSDLLRVLKSQASKQVNLSEFGIAYERVLSRPFDPVDYGLCDIVDLLDEVSENTVVINNGINDVVIAIPKREQTPEEVLRTKQFAVEVVDILRHAPLYGMLFNKFVPAYHHHFGNQCRVSDYGFTKLIELFESIPDIVKIEDMPDNERKVSLTAKEALKVVREQITDLIKSSKLQSVPFVALPVTFLREYGYPLRPELYDCVSIEELVNKFTDSLHVSSGSTGQGIITLKQSVQNHLEIRVWALLLNPPHKALLSNILYNFHLRYGYSITLEQMEKYSSILKIINASNGAKEITLTSRYTLAARLYHLLYENGGTIYLGNFDGLYVRKYGKPLRPSEYDASCLNALLGHFPFLFVVKGRKFNRNVSLISNITALYGIPLPSNMKSHQTEGESTSLQWPPPPIHTFLFNSSRTAISPPKPDTPPTHHNAFWDNSVWTQSPASNLCIPLPLTQTPPLMENPDSSPLTSPVENLLSAYLHTFTVKPPDPSELPMPTKDMLDKVRNTPPNESGRSSSDSFSNILYEPDSSTNIESESSTPSKKKRTNRLAANFCSSIN